MSSEDDPYTPANGRRGVVRHISNMLWAAASLGVFIGAITYAYNLGTRSPDDIPSINPQHSVWKMSPDDPGGREYAGAGLTAHNTRGDGTALPVAGSVLGDAVERPTSEDEVVASLQTPERSLVAVAEETARDRGSLNNRKIVALDTLPPLDGETAPSLNARPAFPPNIGTGSIEGAPADLGVRNQGLQTAPQSAAPQPSTSQPPQTADPLNDNRQAIAPLANTEEQTALLTPPSASQSDGSSRPTGQAPSDAASSGSLGAGSLGETAIAPLTPNAPTAAAPSGDGVSDFAAIAEEALQEFSDGAEAPPQAEMPNRRPDGSLAGQVRRDRGGLLALSDQPRSDLGQVTADSGQAEALGGVLGSALGDDIAQNGVDLGVLRLPQNESIVVGTPPRPEAVEEAPFANNAASQPQTALQPAAPAPQRSQPQAQPQQQAAATPQQTPTTAPTASTDFVVQLAALASEQAVRDRWQDYQARAPQLLGPRELVVEPVTVTNSVTGGESRLFRLRVTAADRVDARRLCKELTERGFTCFVPAQ